MPCICFLACPIRAHSSQHTGRSSFPSSSQQRISRMI